VEEFQHRSQAGLDAARTAYDAFCQRPGLQQVKTPTQSQRPSTWFSQYSGAWTDIVTRAARYHDLTVLQPGADAEDNRAGTVLLESGKPALIAPREPLPYPIRTIAIAWKDKPEAARAVTAAMPLLERARRVVVLIGNEDDHTATSCLDCADAIVSQLAWHGVRAESRYVVPEGRSLPDAVLDSAAEVSAELIVAGAYGRSRLRQWIFGGFTRRVLEGTSIPVFMAH
jgi:nucleotide-binding universal stress UspA family protein